MSWNVILSTQSANDDVLWLANTGIIHHHRLKFLPESLAICKHVWRRWLEWRRVWFWWWRTSDISAAGIYVSWWRYLHRWHLFRKQQGAFRNGWAIECCGGYWESWILWEDIGIGSLWPVHCTNTEPSFFQHFSDCCSMHGLPYVLPLLPHRFVVFHISINIYYIV